jgi:hypothetical protein
MTTVPSHRHVSAIVRVKNEFDFYDQLSAVNYLAEKIDMS